MAKKLSTIFAGIASVALCACAMSPAVLAKKDDKEKENNGKHDITIVVADPTTGAASVDPAKAKKDTDITLTLTPEEGYECESVSSEQVSVSCETESFKMASKDVTISVSFKAVEKPEEETEDEPVVEEEEEEVVEETEAPLTGAASFAVFYIAAAALILGGAFVAVKAKNEA